MDISDVEIVLVYGSPTTTSQLYQVRVYLTNRPVLIFLSSYLDVLDVLVCLPWPIFFIAPKRSAIKIWQISSRVREAAGGEYSSTALEDLWKLLNQHVVTDAVPIQ